MTPGQFVATYAQLARQIAAHFPGLSSRVILAQWAVETGWGSSALAVYHHNLAGIRWYGRAVQTEQLGGTTGKPGTGFAGYASLTGFAADYLYVIGLPYYAAVRSAVGDVAQARALGASPWDAGHYTSGGEVGGSLLSALRQITQAPAPVPAPAPGPRRYTVRAGDTLWAIAARFYGHGTAYPRIAVANRIPAPYVIHVGQVLVIP